MTPTAVPERAAAQRDVRLDFFRGLALFMILYDHVFLGARTRIPFFVQFTPYFWGLGCAAAIFIFISGQAYGVAYGRKLDQLGRRKVVAKTVLRVCQLYVAQLAILALVWSGLHLEILSGLPHTSLTVFLSELGDKGGHLYGSFEALWAVASLRLMPDNFDILPLYMILLLVGPLFLVGLARHPAITMIVSGAVYLAAQLGLRFPFHWLGLAPLGGTNPFAWQILFFMGMALRRWPHVTRRNHTLIISAGIILFLVTARVWLIPRLIMLGWVADEPWWDPVASWHDRNNFTFMRLAYFIVMAYFAVSVMPSKREFWESQAVQLVCSTGTQALPVFCFGVFYTWAVYPIIEKTQAAWPGVLLIIAIGCALSVAVACASGRIKRNQRTARNAVAKLDLPESVKP